MIYWPHINNQIMCLCQTCTACTECHNKALRPPNIHGHYRDTLEQVTLGSLHFLEGNELVSSNGLLLDYLSIHPTSSTLTKTIMVLLEEDFAHFSYSLKLFMNNSTTFLPEQFQVWCCEWGITYLTGAPYHLATNGPAEYLVQSIKPSLRKSSLLSKVVLQKFLM